MTTRVEDRRRVVQGLAIVILGAFVVAPARTKAQGVTSPMSDALAAVVDPADRSGTNPANLRNTLDLWNEFRSVGDGLFSDSVAWQYAQAFAGRRMRARVELPLQLANVTGRTEAGF